MYMSNTTAVVLEAETAYILWVPGFTFDFWGSVLLIYLVFLCCVAFWIFGCVCLRLVSSVPTVVCISGLCLSSSCVYCAYCCLYLWVVFVFVLCLVCLLLSVSLGCPFVIVSSVPTVVCISGLCLSSSCV